mmetsp:Transcript_3135/g.2604  ORF Transcript_3135/g.2604 Transcript_3135/m.2604 type:complete len:116 (+) Transcript_3135:1-348(+)
MVYSDGAESLTNGYNKNKKYINKPVRHGNIQFTIKVFKEECESRVFSVYEADSSLEAAKKMVQNLRMDDDLVRFWAAFIEEKRLKLDLQNFQLNHPGSAHHPLGKITFSYYLHQI